MVKYVEIPVDKLKDGMIVGKSIEDRLGRHLIESGTIVNKYARAELTNYGIKTVLIKVENQTRSSLSPAAEFAVKELRRPDPSTVILGTTVKKRISQGIELIYQNPDKHEVAKAASGITDELMKAIESNDAVALNINALKCSDEYTFKHSVDVATISMVIAKRQGKSSKEIFEIGMAGLLHDIGKTRVPPEILNKPARLTPEEFEVMKKHSTFSYEIVSENHEIPVDVKLGMLQHHEKMDGSGYPYGATADHIHPYAKIITVADIYDALVTERPYKKGKSPREAVEMLMAMTEELDLDAMQSFMQMMILYPVDSLVQLSNGETARVVQRNANLLLRPVVVGIETGNVYDLGSSKCAGIVIL
jgi:HD-GYP domain-containing protein (c-di-GMP phosphodiesterase class II)